MPSPTVPPTLTAAPTSPDRADRSTFSARAVALDDWTKVSHIPELTLALANVYLNATGAYNDATAAAGSAAAAGAVVWVSGTTYAIGDARYSPVDFQTYRRKTAGAGTTDPSLDATNWARVNLAATSIPRSARTFNTIFAEADRFNLIDYTSGTFSQTFPAAATLGSGWSVFLRNSGAGTITLDPNGAELIDGLTNYAMYTGESRMVFCTGTAFYSIILTAFVLEPASTMNLIEPPGYLDYEVFLQAPGGGGGAGRRGAAASNRGGGAGGGAGSNNWASIRSGAPGSSITLTVGADGAGAAAQSVDSTDGASGTAGGTHSFGAFLAAAGGGGGAGGNAGTVSGGAAAAQPAGMISFKGTSGGSGSTTASTAGTADATWAATGGGGGGGLDTANAAGTIGAGGASGTSNVAAQIAGGIAGVSGGTRPGGDGAFAASLRAGTGGGGGAALGGAVAGAAGGNGKRGGGGGGGSASINGQLSGAGGNSPGYFYVKGIF